MRDALLEIYHFVMNTYFSVLPSGLYDLEQKFRYIKDVTLDILQLLGSTSAGLDSTELPSYFLRLPHPRTGLLPSIHLTRS